MLAPTVDAGTPISDGVNGNAIYGLPEPPDFPLIVIYACINTCLPLLDQDP